MSEPRNASVRILLTGADGQVGFELHRELAALGQIIAPLSSDLDLAVPDAIRAAVRDIHPTVIVNAAAYTAVDRAESEPARAEAVNAVAPGVLAEEADRVDAAIVHFSTDYVFDGTAERPYTESDPTNPLGVYGRTKRDGERRIMGSGAPHLIFRTSWVFSRRRQNFMLTMLALARSREELRVVADQRGAPTSARLLAVAVGHTIARAIASGNATKAIGDWSGLYHLSAGGVTSWHGFAEAILAADPRRDEQSCRRVLPISTSEYPTPARRPPYSVLDNSKAERLLGVRLPSWRDHLALTLAD